MQSQPHCVGDILDSLRELADEHGHVSVGDIAERFGTRSYGPFLMIPGLIELTPVGAIPGVPTFLAFTTALVAVQKLFGRDHIWLPRLIRRREISQYKLRRATARLKGIAAWLDRHFHGRFTALTHAPFSRLAALVVLALCLTVPPLEFLPFASSAPMAAIAAIGLAFLVRDGVLMIAALLMSGGAFGLLGYLWATQGDKVAAVVT
jgi:hypothetical protein